MSLDFKFRSASTFAAVLAVVVSRAWGMLASPVVLVVMTGLGPLALLTVVVGWRGGGGGGPGIPDTCRTLAIRNPAFMLSQVCLRVSGILFHLMTSYCSWHCLVFSLMLVWVLFWLLCWVLLCSWSVLGPLFVRALGHSNYS